MASSWGKLALAAVLWGGCQLVASVDRDRLAGGGGGAGAGQGGDGGGSCDPANCLGNDTDCEKRACDADDECIFEAVALGTACSDGDPDAKVCDGIGSCVECNDADDCSAGAVCQTNACVPAICVNGMLDDGETDVDCGGVCNPCRNGLDCEIAGDCVSGFCDAGSCTACSFDLECAAGKHCDAGVCADKLLEGDACTGSNQCVSGFCSADGVCCDTACIQTCEACTAAKTGEANGMCAAVSAGTDPDGECPANALMCRSGGCNGNAGAPACSIAPNGTVCRPGSGDSCDPDETCSGGSCPANVVVGSTTPCRIGSMDLCDPTEMCPGVAGMACPADNVAPMGTECRAAAGSCDVAESCSGVAGQPCPADVVSMQGAPGSPMSCSPYVCDGADGACPATCVDNGDCALGFTCNTGPNKCQ